MLIGPDNKVRIQDMDRLSWGVTMSFDDDKADGFINKRNGITTITGRRRRNGKWIRPAIELKLQWAFEFDQTDRRYRLSAGFSDDSSHQVVDPAGNPITELDTQSLIGLRNALRKNPVAAPMTGHPSRRRSAMQTPPEFIKFKGERYRLAETEEVTTAARRKKKGKRGRKSNKAPAIKSGDRFDDRFYSGEGVEFDIVILCKSRTGEDTPGCKKVTRSIPEEIDSRLTPAQKVEAEKAKEKGELYYMSLDNVGWHWKAGKGATSEVEKVQKALDYIEKQKAAKSPKIIFASRLTKPVGFSSR